MEKIESSAVLENKDDTVPVDLGPDHYIQVDISDALSEKDKVKFTVHTKTNVKTFTKNEVSVIREHEEFIWLHTVIDENENYAGLIIPPPPPKPDFDASREKLQRLGEGEATMVKEEFSKMKAELEAEYLATFKKTVAMHEVFLCRLALHPILQHDANFHIFLEYADDLSVRGKNKKEKIGTFWKRFSQSADEVLLSGQKDVDEFFEHEKNYLIEYHNHIREATAKSDRMARSQKAIADSFIKIANIIETMGLSDKSELLHDFMLSSGDSMEKARKLEARVATDTDLKLSDCLRYFMRDTEAAKDLLYRRLRCLANYEGANKNLERCRAKNKDVPKAEQEQREVCEKFEVMSEKAKSELTNFKQRRIASFKKHLVEYAELQIKHSKAQEQLLTSAASSLREMITPVSN